jgi:hypothetical protein
LVIRSCPPLVDQVCDGNVAKASCSGCGEVPDLSHDPLPCKVEGFIFCSCTRSCVLHLSLWSDVLGLDYLWLLAPLVVQFVCFIGTSALLMLSYWCCHQTICRVCPPIPPFLRKGSTPCVVLDGGRRWSSEVLRKVLPL